MLLSTTVEKELGEMYTEKYYHDRSYFLLLATPKVLGLGD